MLNAMSLASLTLILTSTGSPCVKNKMAFNPIAQITSRGQIGFAQAHVGGQDVIHIMRSNSRKTPFMDVRASDLLISYTYDKQGRLTDRKVWYEPQTTTRDVF